MAEAFSNKLTRAAGIVTTSSSGSIGITTTIITGISTVGVAVSDLVDNANFIASAEIVWVGRPDEAFSIIGIFNRRKSETEVRMNVLVKEVATGRVITGRGTGTITTDIQAAGLQIEEDLPFNKSEFGGAVRKALVEATKDLK